MNTSTKNLLFLLAAAPMGMGGCVSASDDTGDGDEVGDGDGDEELCASVADFFAGCYGAEARAMFEMYCAEYPMAEQFCASSTPPSMRTASRESP